MTHPTESKILIADDDAGIRQALERILASEGYGTVSAADGPAALCAIGDHQPDAMLLDVSMPFVDGLTVCRRLRDQGDRTPVMLLTARHELAQRVAGLDAGADDYVTKPFELEELLARLRALLRRVADRHEQVQVVGPIRLDLPRRQVLVNRDEVNLTRTEFALLDLLMRNRDVVLEKPVIYERIWGYDFGDASRSLDVHIGALRRKLEADGTPRLIQTVRGVGFVLRTPTPGR